MRKTVFAVLAGSSIATIIAATPAIAQDAPPAAAAAAAAEAPAAADAPEEEGGKEIIITGTQIRGIKPVGSNVVSISKEDIRATGALDTNQVLGQLPQSNFFLDLPQPGGGVIQAGTPRVPINRPNLRNIPGTTTGSGSPTLVLIDGHRVVTAGIEQAAVDAGVVPPGILERSEVILDGASAVYGSDAVAGVINFITRKRFNGTEVSARYGMADDYWQMDASITQGFTWGSGGISFNLDFGKSSNILNRDRSFTAPLNWVLIEPPAPAPGGVLLPPQVDDLTCDLPNVRNRTGTPAGAAGIYHVSGSGLAAGPAYCNGVANATYTPAQKRYGAFVTFSQDFSNSIKFETTAFYSNRKQIANQGPFTSTSMVTPANPYYRCNLTLTTSCTAGNQNATQQVSFSYGPALGYDSGISETTTELWQITPEVTAELGSGWQVRGLVDYGRSTTSVFQNRLNTTRQSACVTSPAACLASIGVSDAINPYDIASTNPAILNSLTADHLTRAKQRFTQARLVADGPLFTLPGGEVRLAAGIEWMKNHFKRQNTNDTTFVLGPYSSASTKSKSAFAELVVPVVGDDNAMPGIHSLTLSASGRYDDYGEFGDTFNPKFAITFQPVDWITLRGNWGKSFRAPNAVDKLASSNTQIRCIQGAGAGCISNIQNPVNINPNFNFTATGNTFTMLYLTGTVKVLPVAVKLKLGLILTGFWMFEMQPAPAPWMQRICVLLEASLSTALGARNDLPQLPRRVIQSLHPGRWSGLHLNIQNPVNINPNFNFTATGNTFTMLYLTGTVENLEPETSTGWSVGADISPPIFPGLTLSATYWKIDFKNFISTPNLTANITPAFTVPNTPTAICYDPYVAPAVANDPVAQINHCSATQIQDFANLAPNSGPAALAAVQAAGLNVAILLDGRVRNLGGALVTGVDLTGRFRHEVSFGSVDAGVNITIPIKNDFQLIPGGVIGDELATGDPTFLMNASIGATSGGFRAQGTLRYRSGYVPDPGVTRLASQSEIPSFTVVDLSFSYDVKGSSWLTEDLQLSLNINNVFNEHSPFNKTTGGGVTNGSTLGRLLQFGISKRF